MHIKQDDTKPYLEATLQTSDGSPIDLTSCTVVWRMESEDSSAVVITGSCVVVDATAGQVRYQWQAGDTASPGTYRGEFVITFADSSVLSVPTTSYVQIEVLKKVGG